MSKDSRAWPPYYGVVARSISQAYCTGCLTVRLIYYPIELVLKYSSDPVPYDCGGCRSRVGAGTCWMCPYTNVWHYVCYNCLGKAAFLELAAKSEIAQAYKGPIPETLSMIWSGFDRIPEDLLL